MITCRHCLTIVLPIVLFCLGLYIIRIVLFNRREEAKLFSKCEWPEKSMSFTCPLREKKTEAKLRKAVSHNGLPRRKMTLTDDYWKCEMDTRLLEELEVSQCKEIFVHGNLTSDLVWPKLKSLVLTGNDISDVGKLGFSKMESLLSIILDDNRLRILERSWFDKTIKLRTLSVKSNKITHLTGLTLKEGEQSGIRTFHNLRELDLGFNRLSSLDSEFCKAFQHLKYLNVESNRIEHIEQNPFIEWKNLRRLNFRNNRLHTPEFLLSALHLTHEMESDIENNPWNCDINLLRYLDALNDQKLLKEKKPNLPSIKCVSPTCYNGVTLDLEVGECIKRGVCPCPLVEKNSSGHVAVSVIASLLSIFCLGGVIITVCWWKRKNCFKTRRGPCLGADMTGDDENVEKALNTSPQDLTIADMSSDALELCNENVEQPPRSVSKHLPTAVGALPGPSTSSSDEEQSSAFLLDARNLDHNRDDHILHSDFKLGHTEQREQDSAEHHALVRNEATHAAERLPTEEEVNLASGNNFKETSASFAAVVKGYNYVSEGKSPRITSEDGAIGARSSSVSPGELANYPPTSLLQPRHGGIHGRENKNKKEADLDAGIASDVSDAESPRGSLSSDACGHEIVNGSSAHSSSSDPTEASHSSWNGPKDFTASSQDLRNIASMPLDALEIRNENVEVPSCSLPKYSSTAISAPPGSSAPGSDLKQPSAASMHASTVDGDRVGHGLDSADTSGETVGRVEYAPEHLVPARSEAAAAGENPRKRARDFSRTGKDESRELHVSTTPIGQSISTYEAIENQDSDSNTTPKSATGGNASVSGNNFKAASSSFMAVAVGYHTSDEKSLSTTNEDGAIGACSSSVSSGELANYPHGGMYGAKNANQEGSLSAALVEGVCVADADVANVSGAGSPNGSRKSDESSSTSSISGFSTASYRSSTGWDRVSTNDSGLVDSAASLDSA